MELLFGFELTFESFNATFEFSFEVAISFELLFHLFGEVHLLAHISIEILSLFDLI